MSSDTGVRRMSPVNSQVVFRASIPEVPSNTYGVRGTYSDEGLAEGSLCPALSKVFTGKSEIYHLQSWEDSVGSLRGLLIHPPGQHLTDATYLNNSLGPSHLEHLATPLSSIGQSEVDDLSILGKLGRAVQSHNETRCKATSPPSFSSLKLPSSLLCPDTCGNALEGLGSGLLGSVWKKYAWMVRSQFRGAKLG